jgi:NAD(P)-dependent dehydrogenase (short-subunit alcohol dehydrogenase family)
MMLGPGSIEWGSKRSALEKFNYAASDLALCDRHVGEWVGLMDVPHLQLGISDAALLAASSEPNGEVELRYRRKFADARLGALVAAVHAEMVAGFPNGRLFLDSVEQAMAVALVSGHAVKHLPVGSITGITSAMVENPIAGVNASVPMITKGGLEAITRSLALEYAKDGIRFNAVAPGIVDTPMHSNDPDKFLKGLSPMGMISDVDDIVDAIVYLTEARHVTGEVLHVDAGAHNGKW